MTSGSVGQLRTQFEAETPHPQCVAGEAQPARRHGARLAPAGSEAAAERASRSGRPHSRRRRRLRSAGMLVGCPMSVIGYDTNRTIILRSRAHMKARCRPKDHMLMLKARAMCTRSGPALHDIWVSIFMHRSCDLQEDGAPLES